MLELTSGGVGFLHLRPHGIEVVRGRNYGEKQDQSTSEK
jgi:hypothetical protein